EGSSNWPGSEGPPMQRTERLTREFYAAMDGRDGAALERLLAPGFAAHIAGRPALDSHGFLAALAAIYTAFPDLTHAIAEVLVEGERAAVRLTEHATHQGTFQGIEPDGRRFAMEAMSFHHFEGDQLAGLWMV